MRKTTWVAVALAGLIVLAPVAEGAKKRPKKVRVERVATGEYALPGTASVADERPMTACALVVKVCTTFSVELSSERFVSIEIQDATGTPAPFLVAISSAELQDQEKQEFCGKTDEALKLNGETEVHVYVGLADIPDCAGYGTTGTIEATFSNLK